jgi:hypothetical protein
MIYSLLEAYMTALENLVELVKNRIALNIEVVEDEDIEGALTLSLSAFNMVPCVTYFTFEDEENINQLSDILVTYAGYILLTNMATSNIGYTSLHDDMKVARALWNNWVQQVTNLKQSDSFYEDFVQDV